MRISFLSLVLFAITPSILVNAQKPVATSIQDRIVLIEMLDYGEEKKKDYNHLLSDLFWSSDPYLNHIGEIFAKEARINNDQSGLYRAYYWIGRFALKQGELKKAQKSLDSCEILFSYIEEASRKVMHFMCLLELNKHTYARNSHLLLDSMYHYTLLMEDGDPNKIVSVMDYHSIKTKLLSGEGRIQEAIETSEQSLQYLRQRNQRDSLNYAYALMSKAHALSFKNIERALLCVDSAYQLKVKSQIVDDHFLFSILSKYGELYLLTANYSDYIDKLNSIRSQEGANASPLLKARNNIQLASAYTDLGLYKKAKSIIDEVIPGTIKLGLSTQYGMAVDILSNIWRKQEKFELASDTLSTAISKINNPNLSSYLMIKKLLVDLELNKYDHIDSTLAVLKTQFGNNSYYLDMLDNIEFQKLVAIEMYNKAIPYGERTYRHNEKLGKLDHMATTSKLMSEVFDKLGQYENSLRWMQKHVAHSTEFIKNNHAQTIKVNDLNYEFSKEKEIIAIANEKDKLLIKSQLNRARYICVFTLLVALLGTGLYYLIRRKNREISSQNKELKSLNAIKDTLFQIIGHDLKKPSLAFRGIAKNIDYLIGKGDLKRLQLLGKEIERDAHQFYTLTDNLLNWASIQKDLVPLKPERVRLLDIAQENIDLFASISEKKSLNIQNQIDPNLFLKVDKNSLEAIFRNLFDNAIKFTPKGGSIVLKSVEKDHSIGIEVVDSGLGINPAKLKLITSNDYLSSTDGTNQEKGAGLGLNIVKNLVRKLEGQLNVMSKLGSGSRFIVDLPKI